MSAQRRRAVRVLLPALVLASGFCGISYEILYAKLLGDLLGNQFTINAAVLLTFLFGIGLGTRHAHRLVRHLWAIEAGIGLYAAALTALHPLVDRLLFAQLPALGTSLLACAAAACALLLVPACLIGCSVPLFAAYLAGLRSSHVFTITYGVYNIGAAATALVMEFVLLRQLGLRETTLYLASVNAAVALVLLALGRRAPLAPPPPAGRLHFPRRTIAALVLASVASAVFQLLMIKLVEFVIGPFNETFALVLAVVLLGLTAGSVAAGRFRLDFAGSLLLCLAGLVLLLAGFPLLARAYAALYPIASHSYPGVVALKLGLVLCAMALPSTGFGATIPALLRRTEHVARESGELLFWSSMANAAGFLLMVLVLHPRLDYGPLVACIAALVAAALWLHAGRGSRAAWSGLAAFALALLALRGAWDERLLYVGHTNFHSPLALRAAEEDREMPERFKGAEDVFAIVNLRGQPTFFANGYYSIALPNPSEKVVGALSSMLAPRTDDALVLGIGSGATASTVGLVFDHTDAVEINEAVLANLYRMKQYNFDIEHLPGVKIVHDDGIRFIKNTGKRYSLILNTVNTPLYFSSSKLYTKDFLDLVRQRLTPDGVYVTWLDIDIGDQGADIVLETLADSFDHCWLGYIKLGYFLLACSQEPLGLRSYAPVVGNERLRSYFDAEYRLPLRWVPYSILSTDALSLRSPSGAPINTLDRPVLEFVMARLRPDAAPLRSFMRRIDAVLDPRRLASALGGAMPWRADEFRSFERLRAEEMLATARRMAIRGSGDPPPLPSGPRDAPRGATRGLGGAPAAR